MKRLTLILILAVAGCSATQSAHTPAPTVAAPAVAPEVTAPAKQTVTAAGGVLESIDALIKRFKDWASSDPFKIDAIAELTKTRTLAKTAVDSATDTETKAEAKDKEAKEAQAALATANANILSLTKERNDAIDAKAKAEKFIADHAHDIWGAGTHKFIRELTFWVLLPFLLIAAAIIGLAIVGSLYGIPALTKPVFGSLGGLLDGLRLILYKLATLIWSIVPLAGHYADEFLNSHAVMKAQIAATPNLASPLNGPANGGAKP